MKGRLKIAIYAACGRAARQPSNPVKTKGANAIPVIAAHSFIMYLREPTTLDKVSKMDEAIYQKISRSKILDETKNNSCDGLCDFTPPMMAPVITTKRNASNHNSFV